MKPPIAQPPSVPQSAHGLTPAVNDCCRPTTIGGPAADSIEKLLRFCVGTKRALAGTNRSNPERRRCHADDP